MRKPLIKKSDAQTSLFEFGLPENELFGKPSSKTEQLKRQLKKATTVKRFVDILVELSKKTNNKKEEIYALVTQELDLLELDRTSPLVYTQMLDNTFLIDNFFSVEPTVYEYISNWFRLLELDLDRKFAITAKDFSIKGRFIKSLPFRTIQEFVFLNNLIKSKKGLDPFLRITSLAFLPYIYQPFLYKLEEYRKTDSSKLNPSEVKDFINRVKLENKNTILEKDFAEEEQFSNEEFVL